MRWWPIVFTLWLAGCGQMSGYHARDSYGSGASENTASLADTAEPQVKPGCESARYTVRQDDTLGHIALRCGVRVSALARANGLKSPYVIYPGQILSIPRSSSSSKSTAISSRPASVVKTKTPLDWQWPSVRKAQFDYVADSSGLKGLEVYLDEGEQVVAVAAGEVVYAENSISNFGLMVIIRHQHDYLTVYAHNQRLVVNKGDKVAAGQTIAYSGRSGTTERPKLYFEARHQGRKIHADRLWPRER
jgi:murein DD-endopeptidase MepM/ murein hydrolase activator NlpD